MRSYTNPFPYPPGCVLEHGTWILSVGNPTFADIALATTIAFSKLLANNKPLDERFEYLDYYWNRWKERDSFKRGCAYGAGGLEELDY